MELKREAGVCTCVPGEPVEGEGVTTLNNHDPMALSLGGLRCIKLFTCVKPPAPRW